MSYLTAHNLSIGYRHKNGATTVLKDLNLSLERGSLVALLGLTEPENPLSYAPSQPFNQPSLALWNYADATSTTYRNANAQKS